jgi:hypothetical protein
MTAGIDSNDNHLAAGAAEPEPISLEHQIAHAVLQLGQHEQQIKRLVMVRYPDGKTEALGELLIRLGVYINEAEKPKSRLVLATRMPGR